MFYERSGLHLFTFRGIEVAASLWYGFLMAMVIFIWPAMGPMSMADGVLWALAITISLLVHEFGHAFVAKRYRLSPSIMLHAFGGYCAHQEAATDGEEAKIVFAGPLAGLALAGILTLISFFLPGFVHSSPVILSLFQTLIWLNIVWSLINLLAPIWPLDGGKLFHLFLRRVTTEDKAQRITLQASIFILVPAGILGFAVFRSFFIAIFALFVVMDNWQALQTGRPLVQRRGAQAEKKASGFHAELLEEAEQAMKEEDWREAARLGHHMRAVGSMPGWMMEKVWAILGLSTMELGEYEEALGYLRRAPQKGAVKEAIRRCEEALEKE